MPWITAWREASREVAVTREDLGGDDPRRRKRSGGQTDVNVSASHRLRRPVLTEISGSHELPGPS